MTMHIHVPELHSDEYEEVQRLGVGSFGVCKLMRNTRTGELVAVKFIPRGKTINQNVEREILNHRKLLHPNVIQFKEAFLTESHLAIALEYAPGGELFDLVCDEGKLTEKDARYFFQQLIMGLEYCHENGVCHRDLKLENILLDGSLQRILKICDFGYSKNTLGSSAPCTRVGTVAYIAPEVLSCGRANPNYRGQLADVWSCGVILYIMLVGDYPFDDNTQPGSVNRTIQKITAAQFEMPASLSFSCRDLLRRIFVRDPSRRISIAQIKAHPWFQHALPPHLTPVGIAAAQAAMVQPPQDEDEIIMTLDEARETGHLHGLEDAELQRWASSTTQASISNFSSITSCQSLEFSLDQELENLAIREGLKITTSGIRCQLLATVDEHPAHRGGCRASKSS